MWNFRVVKSILPGNIIGYAIHEVRYAKPNDELPIEILPGPYHVQATNVKDINTIIDRMKACTTLPYLRVDEYGKIQKVNLHNTRKEYLEKIR
jgi:hypothetical protein